MVNINRKPGRRLTQSQVRKKNIFFDFVARPFRSPVLFLIGLVFFVFNGVLIVMDPPQSLRVGFPARDDIIARIEFMYEDKQETEKQRTLEEAYVAPIFKGIKNENSFDRDLPFFLEAIAKYDHLKDVKPEWLEPWTIDGRTISEENFMQLSQALMYLRKEEESQTFLLNQFTELTNELKNLYILDEKTNQNLSAHSKKILIKKENQKTKEVLLSDLLIFRGDQDHPRALVLKVRHLVDKYLSRVFNQGDMRSFELITSLFMDRLKPTIELDNEAIEKSKNEARANVSPVMRRVLMDEVIVRRGQVIGPNHIAMVKAEKDFFAQRTFQEKTLHQLKKRLGRLFIFSIICFVFITMITEGKPTITRNRGRFFSFCLMTTLVVIVSRLLVMYGRSPLWIPLPLMAETFQVVHGRRASLMSTIFIGCLLGLSFETTGVALSVTIGALTCIFCSKNLDGRMTLIVSGICGGGVMALMDLSFNFQESHFFAQSSSRLIPFFSESSVALANCFFSGVLLTGLLPVIEKMFRITTNITWLELGNMNRPLLKRMSVEAPGTWQHSQVLATLSEAAAQKIGVNALMSRVVCYYHDIGKCIKPHYFIENLHGGPNPHEKLTPAMSALIIHSHPKDGAELARQYRLPREVIDAIMQHHGTTRVEYFYRIALEKATDDEEVREEMFRYPGPIPQYKEMGIIMLADSVEGAVRALVQDDRDINPQRIRNQVEKIIKSKLEMGQLDDSRLTLTDLQLIEDEFTRVLQSIHHNRIKYPKSPDEQEEDESDELAKNTH